MQIRRVGTEGIGSDGQTGVWMDGWRDTIAEADRHFARIMPARLNSCRECGRKMLWTTSWYIVICWQWLRHTAKTRSAVTDVWSSVPRDYEGACCNLARHVPSLRLRLYNVIYFFNERHWKTSLNEEYQRLTSRCRLSMIADGLDGVFD